MNKLNLTSMVILDKQNGEYSLIAEIALISSSGKSGESGDGSKTKQVYLKGTGFSFVEARDNLDMQINQPIYLGTVRALVLTERAAEDDLAEYLFRLRENESYRQKVSLVITDDDPETLTQYKSETGQPMGFVIDDVVHTASAMGHTFSTTSADIVNDILANQAFVVQHISLVDNQIKLTGYSVFRSAEFVGFIPIQGSQGLTYFLADHPVWHYQLPAGGMNYTVKVVLEKRKIKPSYQDGKIAFDVDLSFHGIIEYQSGVNLFPIDLDVKRELSGNLNTMLRQQLQDAVQQSQSLFQSDYLQLGECFRIAYPDAFDQMDWAAEYPNADVNIGTLVNISVSDKMDVEVTSDGG